MALSEAARVSRMLGIEASTDQELISAIEIGLPLASLRWVTATVSPKAPEEIIGKIVSNTTLKRRRMAEKSVYDAVKLHLKHLASFRNIPNATHKIGRDPVLWVGQQGSMKPIEIEGSRKSYLELKVFLARTDGNFLSLKEWLDAVDRSHLSQTESEKVERLASIWTLAVDVMGDRDMAREFLERKHPLLGNEAPVDVALSTDRGRQLVQQILLQVQYGTAA